MNRRLKLATFQVVLLVCFTILKTVIFDVNPAMSATINVTANATDRLAFNGQCSLREAITNINNGDDTYRDCARTGVYGTKDMINIPAGTYTTALAGVEDYNASGDYDINKSVIIAGAGANSTIIRGAKLDRLFHINPAGHLGVVVYISGVKITGGATDGIFLPSAGGGIYNNKGKLTISNSLISSNHAGSAGGGIFNFAGKLTISNSVISRNSSRGGGGISNDGALRIINSTISGNTSVGGAFGSGGGISNETYYNTSPPSAVIVTDSIITGNTTDNVGGGIMNGFNDSVVRITNSTISNNSSGSAGGGIMNWSAILTVSKSTISGNSAGTQDYNNGGGIENIDGVATVTNSTITGNSATAGGGGILHTGGEFTVTNSTISANTASYGLAIESYSGEVTISNSILTSGTPGLTCFQSNFSAIPGKITSKGHNLSSDSSCGFSGTGDLQDTAPLLGALANNGGMTKTRALLTRSPAIDAGSCVRTTDQRGYARPFGVACDIGAFEFGASSLPSDFNDYGAAAIPWPTVTPPGITLD